MRYLNDEDYHKILVRLDNIIVKKHNTEDENDLIRIYNLLASSKKEPDTIKVDGINAIQNKLNIIADTVITIQNELTDIKKMYDKNNNFDLGE